MGYYPNGKPSKEKRGRLSLQPRLNADMGRFALTRMPPLPARSTGRATRCLVWRKYTMAVVKSNIFLSCTESKMHAVRLPRQDNPFFEKDSSTTRVLGSLDTKNEKPWRCWDYCQNLVDDYAEVELARFSSTLALSGNTFARIG